MSLHGTRMGTVLYTVYNEEAEKCSKNQQSCKTLTFYETSPNPSSMAFFTKKK